MRALLAPDIVRMWEAGRDQQPIDRAISLLAAADAEKSRDELAALSISRRDSRLLDLRRQTFGDTLNAFSECPQCAGRLEIQFSAATIEATADDCPNILEMKLQGMTARFRLPTSIDLAEAIAVGDIDGARAKLFRRCMLEARNELGESLSPDELSAELVAEITERLAAADPAAEVLLDLRCPFCEHTWQTLFDIAAFFWKEISAHARRLLHEVDAIARAYGWSEAEILGLSAARRQAYLELIGA
jgi:HD-GYP domain-containing protein (c-di-GMP phosphodiesterase class II)